MKGDGMHNKGYNNWKTEETHLVSYKAGLKKKLYVHMQRVALDQPADLHSQIERHILC